MSVSVRIPTILRTYTGGESEVKAEGATLRAVVADLEANPAASPPASWTTRARSAAS